MSYKNNILIVIKKDVNKKRTLYCVIEPVYWYDFHECWMLVNNLIEQ